MKHLHRRLRQLEEAQAGAGTNAIVPIEAASRESFDRERQNVMARGSAGEATTWVWIRKFETQLRSAI